VLLDIESGSTITVDQKRNADRNGNQPRGIYTDVRHKLALSEFVKQQAQRGKLTTNGPDRQSVRKQK
jgi:hypothetical protein